MSNADSQAGFDVAVLPESRRPDRALTYHRKKDGEEFLRVYNGENNLPPDDEHVAIVANALTNALLASHTRKIHTGIILAELLEAVSECTVADIRQACRQIQESDLGEPQLDSVRYPDGYMLDNRDIEMPDDGITVGNRIEQYEMGQPRSGFTQTFTHMALEAALHHWTREQIMCGVHWMDKTKYARYEEYLRFFSPHEDSVFGGKLEPEYLLSGGR